MLKLRIFSIAAFVLAVAPAAFALNNRSAVSINGLDTNPCTTAQPCRSFGAAIALTNSGGEIIALDSAGYGPFVINVPMTVSGAPGVHAAITVTSGEGIHVQMSSSTDRVLIRNLVLIGAGGTEGIHQVFAAAFTVTGCLIRGFSGAGIFADPNGGNTNVYRTAILDNTAGTGIMASGGQGSNLATITDCTIQGNNVGVDADYNTKVVVAHSTITGNTTGAMAESDNIQYLFAANLVLEACTIAHNGTGVAANAANNNTATVYLSQNVIAFNTTGVAISGPSSIVYSFVNNRFAGNGADGGPFTAIAFK
jgi:Right handed beta helix region